MCRLGGAHIGGRGRQSDVDQDKLYCTHCGKTRHTRETCWELMGKPRDFCNATVTASPAESTKWNADINDKERVVGKDESQILKDELMSLRQRH